MILLTGATGFLGRNFVFEYIKNAPIKILVRRTSDVSLFKDNPRIHIVSDCYIDSKNLEPALHDVEMVIHSAARTAGRNFSEFYQTNVILTKNLVEAMKKNKVNKLLFISSQSAGGTGGSEKIINEFSGGRVVSFYGLSKKMAEDVVKTSGLQYTILRPCSVYGPYDFEILKFIRLLSKGVYPVIGNTSKYISLIYVKDLIRLMQKIVCMSIFKQKVYYVSDGVCYQFDEVVREILQIMHKSYCLRINVPQSFAFIFGLLNDLFLPEKKRLIGFDKVREMSKDFWVCQSSVLHKEIDWRPEFSLNLGMKETIRWYQDNGYLGS